MQTDRNQHAVGKSVDECAERSGSADELPEARQSGIEDRVEVAHANAMTRHAKDTTIGTKRRPPKNPRYDGNLMV